ncbi:MAG: DUF4351 domain-containing protein [Chloroflexi bacterium]|nr:DUF4351 domain-containing protein [Chloroflexota bacterium]MCI0578347.1 DUF4351 domain-containing protein [Chloroflexota bacterium]MCI0646250.1 DUF4351 domain-containing protein [Chloroflexota bacterium]MCI0732130.1 DUF4351 domain-containing protein [Chloroflexota bacterium]
MKHIYDPALLEQLPSVLGLLRQLANQETALEYLETMLRYLSTAAENVTQERLTEAVETAFRGRGDKIMPTLAEKWIEQGVERSILQVLERRFGQRPAALQERLASLSLETLDMVLDEALLAADLPAFEQRLKAIEAQAHDN